MVPEQGPIFTTWANSMKVTFSRRRRQSRHDRWNNWPTLYGFTKPLSGIWNRPYALATIRANHEMLLAITGQHPKVGTSPRYVAAAAEGISSALEFNNSKTSFYSVMQLYL